MLLLLLMMMTMMVMVVVVMMMISVRILWRFSDSVAVLQCTRPTSMSFQRES